VDPGSVLVAFEFSFSATLRSFKLDVAGYAPAWQAWPQTRAAAKPQTPLRLDHGGRFRRAL